MSDKDKNSIKNKLPKKPQLPKNGFNFYWIYVVIVVIVLGLNFVDFNASSREIDFRKFENTMLKSGDVDKLIVVNKEICEVYIKPSSLNKPEYKDVTQRSIGNGKNYGPHYYFNIGSIDSFEKKLSEAQHDILPADRVNVVYETRKNWGGDILSWILFPIIMIALWIFIMKRMSSGGGPGGQIFNIGKSRAALFDQDNKVKITFQDVAGLEEAKEEVMEIVEFLKNPSKFTKLGGKIPKGALLVGPPGTGKTLLAKAVAGEAGVPFFSLSGSDFVEMFVGVGAARVRDLFNQAKSKAPSIIFIDEIDAVGRSRGKGSFTGGNDERENTLNSLLVEMDGFGTNSGVIILAATNRPDVLDSALLRPGRFDRQISIDKPDINGREAIFKVHLKPLKLAADVNLKKLSEQTPGFAGAEIANVCNEAALIAARKNKSQVEMQDFQDAVDRVIGGLEKKNKLISQEEKRIVAYHEAGHAIAGWFLEHSDPLVKVSIVPRGIAALGYAQYLPKEQFLYTTEQLTDSMCMALGGRVAEELIFGKISTGALSDLERITKMAYSMVTIYGMNKRIGNVSFYDPQQSEYGFTKPYSESTAQAIDEEVKKIIENAYQKTKDLLTEKSNELELVAQELLKKEVIFESDIERLVGKRPFPKHHHLIDEEKSNHTTDHVLTENTVNNNNAGQNSETQVVPNTQNL
ncbi:MAG: ATP-dependent zinc metalloprotease FtsH [Bacteroidia bacterium]|nr:ATP-dependent zinc metalloprotease FtsH [Bacteroidia bacterium]MCZ2247822.1 ATP-dependent zinc metalloprotease FtsH [Bacteroidia bacterium]